MKPALGYIRVSTQKQGRSGLGLEAQQAALARFADVEGFQLLETFTETQSGKHDESHRPVLEHIPIGSNRGFPKIYQSASLAALIRFRGDRCRSPILTTCAHE